MKKIYKRDKHGVALNLWVLKYLRLSEIAYIELLGFTVYERVGDKWTFCLRRY